MSNAQRKGTKSERLAEERFYKQLRRFDDENDLAYAIKSHIPSAWKVLEDDVDVTEPKIKITLLLDESVAKYYRALGHGYQARINRILATYAQMKICDVREFFDYVNNDPMGGIKNVRAEYRDGLTPKGGQ